MIERTEAPSAPAAPARTWDVAIVGAGYVGVPLAHTFALAGRSVLLVDVLQDVVDALNRGESHVEDVRADGLGPLVAAGRISASTDYDSLRDADAIVIALPTPLSKQRSPTFRSSCRRRARSPRAAKGSARRARVDHVSGHDTRAVAAARERKRASRGRRLQPRVLAERVDPGSSWDVREVPKVVGGVTEACTTRAAELYRAAINQVHPVSSPEAAELTKLLENIFRSVNIALVNELAQLAERMDIDVWEVVDAAATKPFGFARPPGPGLGGHCIPIDPFYLTWKAREYGFTTEFIELAGRVNESMPYYCRSLISQALNHAKQKSMSGARVLILGVAYKPDIGDVRESPALKLIEPFGTRGPTSPTTTRMPSLPELDLQSVPLEPEAYDCVIVTDHAEIDYGDLVDRASLIVDLQRDRRHGQARGARVEALTPTVGMAGLGHWGKNLVRNFDALADLRALCDVSPDLREGFARRYPNTRVTADFSELVEDPELDAIVIATPVPTHYALTKQALEGGKHVFVEKPPAMRGEEMEELAALAAERGLTCMPGHLLLYHPAVRKLKQLVDAGELGDVLCVYGNRQNLGIIRKDENALWSLGVHDSVILYLLDEEPSEAWAHGNAFLNPGVEDVVFCYLRFPSGKIAHMHLSWLDPHKMRKITVVGRDKMVVFDDMDPERKVTIYEKAVAARDVRRVADADRRHLQPQDPERRAASARVPALPRARAGRG